MSAKQGWLLSCLLMAGINAWAGDKTADRQTASIDRRADFNDDELEDFAFTDSDAVTGRNGPPMEETNLLAVAQRAAHGLLVWIGFGTLVGLTAKAIMPGRDPGGPVATLLMGIAGSLIGCGILLLFGSSYRVTPISPLGFIAGTAGAFLLLLFYRILSNSYIVESTDGSIFKHVHQKPSV